MKQFSFIVPVYNTDATFLKKCIASITHQSIKDIEVIVIDDGSENQCRQLCDSLVKDDDRIIVVHLEENMGVSEARNRGILLSKGKWISFVDSDDWIEENYCSCVLGYIEREAIDPDVIMFQGFLNYEKCQVGGNSNKKKKKWLKRDIEKLQIEALSFCRKEYQTYGVSIESINTKIFSREMLVEKKLRMPSLPHREDSIFFQKSLEASDFVLEIPDCLYHYRDNPRSAVNSYRKKAPLEQKEYIQELWRLYSNSRKTGQYYNAMFYSVFISMQIVISNCFFNPNNTESYFSKQKECKEYFDSFPFNEVFKHIKIRELKLNHLVKALCIRIHWYSGMSLLRKIYIRRKYR